VSVELIFAVPAAVAAGDRLWPENVNPAVGDRDVGFRLM
jgi:hypothetical protein